MTLGIEISATDAVPFAEQKLHTEFFQNLRWTFRHTTTDGIQSDSGDLRKDIKFVVFQKRIMSKENTF